MNDVFFYNFDFQPLEQLSGFISLNATKKYCGFGTAEIHLPISKTEIIGMLMGNPYIICVSENVQMIVTGWQLAEDIAIFGRTPEWLLTKRVAAPFEQSQKTPAEIAEYAVQSAMGDFAVVSGIVNLGDKMNYSVKAPETVYDVVCGVLKPSGLGFKLYADITGKRFTFSVYRGEERSLMISESNRTAFDMKYTRDMQNAVDNCGWFKTELKDMGEWSASDNSPALSSGMDDNLFTYYKITTAGTRFGLTCQVGSYLYCDTVDGVWKITADKPDIRWTYLDNSTAKGAMHWEGLLKEVKSQEEARLIFADMRADSNSETSLRHVEYGTDYSEGDIVRVQTQFGDYRCSDKKRVSAVEIFYDTDAVGTKPILESVKE